MVRSPAPRTCPTEAEACISRYIRSLCTERPHQGPPKAIDLVLDGGGVACCKIHGVLLYIRELEEAGLLRVERIEGVSGGAWLGLLYVIGARTCGMMRQLRRAVSAGQDLRRLHAHARSYVDANLTDGQAVALSGKLSIRYIDTRTWSHVRQDSFTGKADLVEALARSCHIPIVTDGHLLREGRYVDGVSPGGFSDQLRPSLLVTAGRLYTPMCAVWCRGECGETRRVLEGVGDAHEFFNGGMSQQCTYMHASAQGPCIPLVLSVRKAVAEWTLWALLLIRRWVRSYLGPSYYTCLRNKARLVSGHVLKAAVARPPHPVRKGGRRIRKRAARGHRRLGRPEAK